MISAGEFQPASVALWDRRNDFDLWRNIVREYSEELLGTSEHDGTRSKPIDYDAWPLYNEEGEIVAIGDGRATEGVPFSRDSVRRLLSSEPMASPGAACLALAWRHRDRILGL